MKNLIINPDGSYTFSGTATRSELARLYEMSDKRFRKALKTADVYLGRDNILTARQVKQVFDALGPPTIHGTFAL